MAAVVAGLARLLQPAMLLPGGQGTCQGLGPWYLLLGLRLVALFIADGPWSSASPGLACNWTLVDADIRPFCSALCYNQRFFMPVSSSWGFAFLVSLFPVGLMGFIRAGFRPQKRAAKQENKELTDPTDGSLNKVAVFNVESGRPPSLSAMTSRTDMVPSEPKTLFRCSWPSAAFGLCVALLLASELGFFWVVIFLQVPSLSRTTFLCLPGAQICPKALECVMAGQADKEMALWALAFTAIVNILACLAYLIVRLGKASQCQRSKCGKQDHM